MLVLCADSSITPSETGDKLLEERAWQRRGFSGNSIKALAIDPTDKNILYVGTQYLFKSVDQGSTWDTLLVTDTGISEIEINNHDPQIIHVLGDGLRKSADGGISWTRIDTTVPRKMLETVAVFASNPLKSETVYVGTTSPEGW